MAPVKKELATPKEVPKSSRLIAKETTESHQSNRKEFDCPHCDKKFFHRATFKNHLNIHEEKYKCSHCGKVCLSAYNLKRHEASHTEEKPFKCDKCQRGFIQRSDLVHHKCTMTPARKSTTKKDDAVVAPSAGQVKCEPDGISRKLKEENRRLEEENRRLEKENKKLRDELDEKTRLCEEYSEKLKEIQRETEAANETISRQAAENRATEQENVMEETVHALSETSLDEEAARGLPDLSFEEIENVEPLEEQSVPREKQAEQEEEEEESTNDTSFEKIDAEEINGAAAPADENAGDYITRDDLGLPHHRCVFCWGGDHLAERCSTYTKVSDRCTLQQRFHLCAVCLTLHPKRPCPSHLVKSCNYCDAEGHHPSLCRSTAHQDFLKVLKKKK